MDSKLEVTWVCLISYHLLSLRWLINRACLEAPWTRQNSNSWPLNPPGIQHHRCDCFVNRAFSRWCSNATLQPSPEFPVSPSLQGGVFFSSPFHAQLRNICPYRSTCYLAYVVFSIRHVLFPILILLLRAPWHWHLADHSRRNSPVSHSERYDIAEVLWPLDHTVTCLFLTILYNGHGPWLTWQYLGLLSKCLLFYGMTSKTDVQEPMGSAHDHVNWGT